MPEAYQPGDFITIGDVANLTHMSRAGIYRGINGKRFPAPVKFGPSKSLWIRAEIQQWISDRVAER